MSSNPNPSLPIRAITDIISPYREVFRDIDFRYVLSALISREEFLTRDFNLRSMQWEREQRRLRREISAIKDREEEGIRVLELEKDELYSKLEILKSSSIESNDCVEGLIKVVQEKDEEICRLVGKLSDIRGEIEKITVLLSEFEGFVWKVEVLEKEKCEIEVKMNEFRREKECLVADKVKFDEKLRELELLSAGIKDEIEGLRRVIGGKSKEICGKDERIEVLMRRAEVLEKEKEENEVKFDEIRRENESLMGNLAKFDEQLNKVKMEKNGFEIELIEFRKENEYLIAANKGCEEQLDKLEKEKSEIEIKLHEFQRENQRVVALSEKVVEQLDKLEKDKIQNEIVVEKLRRDNEYVKSMKAKSDEEMESLRIFSREMDVTIKEMKLKNDAQSESLGRENEVKIEQLKKKIEGLEMEKSELMKEKEEVTRKYEKQEQRVAKLEVDVARLLLGNVPNRNKLMNDQIEKVLSCVIDVLDSEEDSRNDRVEKIQRGVNTTSGFPRETKRQRVLSQCSNEKYQSDDTSDKSLNPSCKVKKAVDLSQVDLMHQPPIAASGSRSDKKFATPPTKQVVAPLRPYEETSVKVKEPLSYRMLGGDNSQHNDLSTQAHVVCNTQGRDELVAACRRSRGL